MAQPEPAGGEGLMAAEFALERIYVKDLSFESPRAPEVFRSQWQPSVQLDIGSKTSPLGDDRFEVVLTVTASVRTPDAATDAIVEVQQAGIFRLKGMADEQRARMLATFCPNILFPYIRETVDTLMTKGGLPPLLLAPVNFDSLYEEALKRRNSAESSEVSARSERAKTEH
jgi:preprotein translocase subunit SecB